MAKIAKMAKMAKKGKKGKKRQKQQKNSQTKFEKIMVKKYSIFDLLKPYNRVILQT